MSTSKQIDKLCLSAVAVCLVLTLLFMFSGSLGLRAAAKSVKYESSLFDDSYVHKIDIVMDGWDSFIQSCENEEYAACTVVVDGKKHANIGIRAKGNTSLSSVKSMGSQRYSFKLEFDHYQSGKSLDGLDKLCLNNLIQDNTMMKDYLVYRMMADFGADAPLCSFAWLTVNGQDWGLYLAVEGVEDSFLSRNYGSDAGALYKPDSTGFGGGRGNGKNFNMEDFDASDSAQSAENSPDAQQGGFPGEGFPGMQQGSFPGGQQGGFPGGEMPGGGQGFDRDGGARGPGGMGSADVKLQYIDEDPASYSNIFNNTKTEVSEADQQRLIAALRQLSAYEEPTQVLDADEVLRYFVVHNFVCNGDSYTGGMIHNYYLHEQGGRLGMIPWDYNLAFGAFQGGSAASAVNESIDCPVSGGDPDDRPMLGWIFSDEAYTAQYHALFSDFLARWFAEGQLDAKIARTAELIRPWVERDPTKFCTLEAFDGGVAALRDFVSLRAQAVERQLEGDSNPVDVGDLQLSDMGSMGGGRGGPGGEGGFPSEGGAFPGGEGGFPSEGGAFPGGGGFPGAFDPTGSGSETPAPPEDGSQPQAPAASGAPEGSQPSTPQGRGGRGGRGGEGFPGGDTLPGGNTDAAPAQAQSNSPAQTWLLVGVSFLTLALGLLIAGKKKS